MILCKITVSQYHFELHKTTLHLRVYTKTSLTISPVKMFNKHKTQFTILTLNTFNAPLNCRFWCINIFFFVSKILLEILHVDTQLSVVENVIFHWQGAQRSHLIFSHDFGNCITHNFELLLMVNALLSFCHKELMQRQHQMLHCSVHFHCYHT